ncbi:MAG: 3-dehydroquinate synthase [Myxococcota bacterium]|nr:3-dehydroquinate synthase [Myxococcota bacterium]
MPEPRRIVVELGERAYPIVLGPLSGLGAQLAAGLSSVHRCVVVTNPVVGPLYLKQVVAAIQAEGWEVNTVEVIDGEQAKQLSHYEQLIDDLLNTGLDRNTLVVALGGGVTGDLAGFAAATVLRGLRLVQVPTSLLAMVDSSVGGKTGLNTSAGKNLVGAFHQPSLVQVDVSVLSTLSDRDFRSGLGEVVKHAVIADATFFAWLEENAEAIVRREVAVLSEIVARCCEIKAAVVARDEREAGERAVLNLGHTVAHALEAVSGFGVIPHGEAVGIGLVAEAVLGVERGWSHPEVPLRIAHILTRFGLPTHAPPLPLNELQSAVSMDKKTRRGKMMMPVATAVGEVRLFEVLPEFLGGALRAALGDRRS